MIMYIYIYKIRLVLGITSTEFHNPTRAGNEINPNKPPNVTNATDLQKRVKFVYDLLLRHHILISGAEEFRDVNSH